MEEQLVPQYVIEATDEWKALEDVYGSKIDPERIEDVVHELTHHRYPMPSKQDYQETSDSCNKYAPEIASNFDIAYYDLVQSIKQLGSALRERRGLNEKAKLSSEYVKIHKMFTVVEKSTREAIRRGMERREKEKQEYNSSSYV